MYQKTKEHKLKTKRLGDACHTAANLEYSGCMADQVVGEVVKDGRIEVSYRDAFSIRWVVVHGRS